MTEWVAIHNIFLGCFLFGLLFWFVFRFLLGCDWLRVVMENPSQACLLSCVVHGVTCECHKLGGVCFLFVCGYFGFAGVTCLGWLGVCFLG